MVFAFAPIVGLLLGLSAITVPWETLLLSVGLYIVVPVVLAQIVRRCRAVACRRARPCPPARAAAARVTGGAAGHAGAAVRLPGRTDHRPAAHHRAARGADPDPGLLQRGPCLSAQQAVGRGALRGGAVRPDRRQQLLRAGRGRRHQPLRLLVGRGAGHRGRRADRGAGHADGGADRQCEQALVRAGSAVRRRVGVAD